MLRLDHVGFLGRDLEALRAAFAALGFMPTEARALMKRTADGGLAPLDQSSAHVVFEQGYVELSATNAPNHLAQYAGAGDALVIAAFGVDDIPAAHAGCLARGVRLSAPAKAARRIEYGEKHGEARFEWFMVEPADAPDGLVCFVRHETPELVFQPEVQQHENGAVALRELTVTASDLEASAERYRSILGHRPQRHPDEYVFTLGGTILRVTTPARLRATLALKPRVRPDALMAMHVVVRDLAHARQVLRSRRVPCVESPGRLVIAPAKAGGAVLVLCSATPPNP